MNGQEVIIFFSPFMGGIFLPFLFPDKCSSCSSVMAVSNIGEWYFFSKQFFNKQVCPLIFYNPELMPKAIFCNKIIFRYFFVDNIVNDLINLFNGRVCKKNRFYICIIYADMHHTILFFIGSREFMLLNDTIYIVIDRGTPNDSVLSPSSVSYTHLTLPTKRI